MNTMNSTTTSDKANFVFATVAVFLGTFIVVANSLMVVAVVRFPCLRTRANMYIVSLSCTDLLVGVYQFMLAATYLPNSAELFDTCRTACVFIYSWAYCTAVCSGLNTCLIAFDRYVYIAKPLHYYNLLTDTRVKVAIAVTWLVAILYGFTLFFVDTFSVQVGCSLHGVVPIVYRSYMSSFVFLFCCGVSVLVYASIARVAFRHAKAITAAGISRTLSHADSNVRSADSNPAATAKFSLHADFPSSSPSVIQPDPPSQPTQQRQAPKSGKGSWKALKLFIVVFGIFMVCWLPYFVTDIVSVFHEVSPTIYFSLLFLGFLNSAMNVFVYPVFNRNFRTALKNMLGCGRLRNSRVIPSVQDTLRPQDT